MSNEDTLKDICDSARSCLKGIEITIRKLEAHPEFACEQSYKGQHGEMLAQAKLAVRHIEDARMRLGKVLQYSGDGVSIYDKA
jgi:hypothetical protein